ncbi:hypothetical protein [Marinobacter sp. tcs-11]|uniref:hypothetical protein n=1 Tax=Marinobacter sp. tcs-11 TaxID=1742860 RepID=UPI00257B41F0|nr:hypothetical protein [Marinobacter sp. tcs-11]
MTAKGSSFFLVAELDMPSIKCAGSWERRVALWDCALTLGSTLTEMEERNPMMNGGDPVRLETNYKRLLRIKTHPKDRSIARIMLPHTPAPDRYRDQMELHDEFEARITAILESENKKLKGASLRAVGSARIRPKAPIAGHACPEEVSSAEQGMPGQRIHWSNPKTEEDHPNTVIDRVENDLAHCFDDNDEEFTVRISPA